MRRMLSKFLAALGCLALIGTGSMALPAAEIIDNFTTPQNLTIPSNMTQTLSPGPLAGAGIVGGSRDTTLSGTAANAQSVQMQTLGGFLLFATGDSSFGTLQLQYDGAGGGLGNALVGNEEVTVSFLNLDLGFATNLDVTVTITDSDADSVSITQSVNSSSLVPFVLAFDFGSSSGVGPGQINFGDLTSVTIDFATAPQNSTGGGVDFILTNIMAQPSQTTSVIPEPSSVAIWLLLGAVALTGKFSRRRRRPASDSSRC